MTIRKETSGNSMRDIFERPLAFGDYTRDVEYEASVVSKCREAAILAHAGQKRWDGEDYFTAHVAPVAQKARYYFGMRSECVALLHDVMEDNREWTESRLYEAGMDSEVVISVRNLTRNGNEDYADYIERLADSNDGIAIRVKLIDLSHNLSSLPKKQGEHRQRRDKYELAMLYLRSKL